MCAYVYRPPEGFLDGEYGSPLDIWSAACILHELKGNETLFCADTEVDMMMFIFEMVGSPCEDRWPGCSRMPYFNADFPVWPPQPLPEGLFKDMLVLDPAKRISAAEALRRYYPTSVLAGGLGI